MNGDLSPEDVAALREETPLERIGSPEEVAQAAAFLLEQELRHRPGAGGQRRAWWCERASLPVRAA